MRMEANWPSLGTSSVSAASSRVASGSADAAPSSDRASSNSSWMRPPGTRRRRLDLAMTLVARPEIVFLDEPTTGLDPRSRAELWDIVRELVAAGTTILLTTQYLEEADELADRIAVLDRGTIVADGTPSELKRLIPGGRIQLEFEDARALEDAASALPDATRDDAALTLDVPSDGQFASIRVVMDRLEAQRVEPRNLTIHTPDLDDVFLALTGQEQPSR